MTNKSTIRSRDRSKLKKYYGALINHYTFSFKSNPYCNRCKKIFPIEELEIHHINYNNDYFRFGELLCNPCHVNVEKGDLPSFESTKHDVPQTVLIFQKDLSGISVMSRLEGKKTVLTSKLKILPKTITNSALPLGFFDK